MGTNALAPQPPGSWVIDWNTDTRGRVIGSPDWDRALNVWVMEIGQWARVTRQVMIDTEASLRGEIRRLDEEVQRLSRRLSDHEKLSDHQKTR
jgi:hypothetical protein